MTRLRIVFTTILFASFAAFSCAQEPREEPKAQQQEGEKPPKPERKENAKPPRDEAKPAHEQHEQQAQQGQHARPAGKSAHIPNDKFRAHFGRTHTFVINRPVIVEGQPRFQYAGYWFVFVDPWPVEWLYTDDCYIDFVDGDYFLFDLVHPGVHIALFVMG